MIFYIVVEDGEEVCSTGIAALENLAHAGLCGSQLVIGSRFSLLRFSQDERLSPRARAYYRRTSQILTQLGVVLGKFGRLDISMSGSGGVPLATFANADYCEKSQLLAENLTDFDVLIELSRKWMSKLGTGLKVNLRPLNGGGSTTAQVLRNLDAQASGPVLCVVDSDRKFDASSIGSTALTCRRAERQISNKWRVTLHVIEQRELENILPSDVRNAACVNTAGVPELSLNALAEIDKIYLDYCCLKEGDGLCRMIRDAKLKGRNDLVAVLRSLDGRGFPAGERCDDCERDIGCFESPALGSGFLARVADRLRDVSFHTDVDAWGDAINDLIAKVISAGLAQGPQRA